MDLQLYDDRRDRWIYNYMMTEGIDGFTTI